MVEKMTFRFYKSALSLLARHLYSLADWAEEQSREPVVIREKTPEETRMLRLWVDESLRTLTESAKMWKAFRQNRGDPVCLDRVNVHRPIPIKGS
jgi:hypothetical protein